MTVEIEIWKISGMYVWQIRKKQAKKARNNKESDARSVLRSRLPKLMPTIKCQKSVVPLEVMIDSVAEQNPLGMNRDDVRWSIQELCRLVPTWIERTTIGDKTEVVRVQSKRTGEAQKELERILSEMEPK
jgi:hypothetical protein